MGLGGFLSGNSGIDEGVRRRRGDPRGRSSGGSDYFLGGIVSLAELGRADLELCPILHDCCPDLDGEFGGAWRVWMGRARLEQWAFPINHSIARHPVILLLVRGSVQVSLFFNIVL